MNPDDKIPVQHSAAERRLRRLIVLKPAAYAPDKRLDVIHEPISTCCGEARNRQHARRRRRRPTSWPASC